MLSVDLSQTKRMMKRRTLQSMEINPEFLQAVVPVGTHFTHIIIDIVPSKQVYLLFIIYSVSQY